MEGSSFHSQMLSVMEVLAKAAAAEINRRVDDCCAVLRLEVSQSRRDIDALQRKCEVMEAELRRSRARVRRKVFYPPLVRVGFSKETHNPAWDRNTEDGAQGQVQLSAEAESAGQNEAVQIKEERADDEVWKSSSEDKLIEQPPCFAPPHPAPTDGFFELYQAGEQPPDAEVPVFPTDVYDAFPEQRAEASVKREEGGDNAAPLDPGHGVTMEAELSYARLEYEQIPAPLAPQSGACSEDAEPRVHPGRSHFAVASAARVRRRARTFGFKRPQQADGHHGWPRISSVDQSAAPAPGPHPYRDARAPDEDLLPPPLPPPSRSGLGLARRMRSAWRPGVCEKRFACTYCDKSFMRFSQLKEHLRSHTGEKPFSCLQCGRSFTKQCNLIRHAVVHSGEKPYECSMCGKCFTQRSSLKSHQKTAH